MAKSKEERYAATKAWRRRNRQHVSDYNHQYHLKHRAKPKKSEEDRILEKYIPVTETGCWLWTDHWNNKGYGMAWYCGKREPAQRTFWRIFKGHLPDDLFVCHKCDIPACVNPDHMFLGTHQENMQDMVLKKRTKPRKGEANLNAKLTEERVRFLRNGHDGRSIRELALEWGATEAALRYAKSGSTWKHVS